MYRYTTAKTWTQLSTALNERTSGSGDELVVVNSHAKSADGNGPTAKLVDISIFFPNSQSKDTPEASKIGKDKGAISHPELSSLNPSLRDAFSYTSFSAEELSKARIIWFSYRKYRSRKAVKAPMSLLRSQVFEACLRASHGMQGRYRLLYLGALPGLFACLQSLQAYTRQQKKVANKKLLEESHLELERVQEEITELT